MEWARKKTIQREVANVPDDWLFGFARARERDTRKFGTVQSSTMLYRVAGVLDAIERGELYGEDGNIVGKMGGAR